MKHFREVVRAETPEQAVRLRKAGGDKALYIAGGTMVVPLAARTVEVLVDIGRLDLAGAAVKDSQVTIGALTRLADLLSPQLKSALPLVFDAAHQCATPLIRNMATLGGALVVAHLPSDIMVALLAHGARLEIVREGETSVNIEDLLAQGWLRGHDLILRVVVGIPPAGTGSHFAKFGRSAIDIALVNVAASLHLAKGGKVGALRLAVGQSYSLPMLLADVADEARGKQISVSLIESLARQAAGSIKPRSDFRASAEYRKHLVEVLVARSLFEAATKAGWQFDA